MRNRQSLLETVGARFPGIGKKAKVSLIVRELNDGAMLKMMAADNDDAYNLTPAFILETVAASRASKEGELNRH